MTEKLKTAEEVLGEARELAKERLFFCGHMTTILSQPTAPSSTADLEDRLRRTEEALEVAMSVYNQGTYHQEHKAKVLAILHPPESEEVPVEHWKGYNAKGELIYSEDHAPEAWSTDFPLFHLTGGTRRVPAKRKVWREVKGRVRSRSAVIGKTLLEIPNDEVYPLAGVDVTVRWQEEPQ